MSKGHVDSFLLIVLMGTLGFGFFPTGVEANISVHGYVEPSYGVRYQDDGPIEDQNVLLETRALLESQWYGSRGESLDLRVLAQQSQNEDGDVDIREGSIFLPLGRSWELRLGRQVLSWAPAQFEFINDHFAKDFKSFFIGRDLEFFKAPNDVGKLSYFGDYLNADLVLAPQFDPDLTPSGEEIPLFNPGLGRLVGADSAPARTEPDNTIEDGELHLRLHKQLGRWEAAIYGYRGFTGAPVGWLDGENFHPELTSGGFSLRGPLWGSIVWLETAYDDIRHTLSGDTVGVPPDRGQLMLGVRYRSSPTARYMVQGTWSRQLNGSRFRQLLPPDDPNTSRDRYRLQAATTRTYWEDRLEVVVRGFLGTTEEDWHLRLTAEYEWSDAININIGSLLYGAEQPQSRFGALKDHDLFFTRLRYSF